MKNGTTLTLSLLCTTLITPHTLVSENRSMLAKQVLKAITAPEAPAAIGPYSHAIEIAPGSRLLQISGQVPFDPKTNTLVTDAAGATHQCMAHLKAILNTAGMDFTNVTKTTIFLTDMNDFKDVNTAYESYFKAGNPFPARVTVAVKELPRKARLEIAMDAAQGEK